MAQILRLVPRTEIHAVNDRKTLKKLKTREPQIAITLFGAFSDHVGSQRVYISANGD